jgi:hypothetical protein
MDKEIIWRPVKGVEDRYEVSNTGLVRTKPRVLKSFPAKKGGHHQINLGLHRRTYVHRLVAEAFLELDPSRLLVNHKNGNPSDNRVENLEWCTPSENVAHGYRTNKREHYASVPVIAITDDGEIVEAYKSATEAARSKGVTKGAVASAIRRNGRCAGLFWRRA